ncbi:NUDIX domain-containing protein [Salinispora tropica]|uniref:NUDIX domain-containing protein n=1 Tax=Salinispora tropica TaxID=168695 RepID=UPI0005BAD9FE|nr:NUDIX domain-containing protein [Salinispora tropica]
MVARVDVRIAGVILVDPQGRLLLQLRDGNTRVDPHCWSLPGGHLDPGEDPLAAAHRELYEETGLKVDEFRLFWRGLAPVGRFPGAVGEFSIFYAPTGATDADVVCGEGAAMRFVDRSDVPALEFGRAYAEIVPHFLGSAEYRQLVWAG